MSRTKTAIGIEIKGVENSTQKLWSLRTDPRVVEVEEKLRQVKELVMIERRPAIAVNQTRIAELKAELNAVPSKVPQPSEKLQAWLKRFCSGMDWGYGSGPKIIWASEDEQYVILTYPGNDFNAGLGSTHHSATKHELIFVPSSPTYLGPGMMEKRMVIAGPVEGRLLKTTKDEWIAKVKELQAKAKEIEMNSKTFLSSDSI